MRVLHLYSDWRWTGPAEPTVNLVRALADQGVETVLACRKPQPGQPQSICSRAGALDLASTTAFHLNRYLHPLETLMDLRRLTAYLQREDYALVHCHLSHDHFLAGWATRKIPGLPVVRSNHKAVPLPSTLGARWLLRYHTAGLLEFSEAAMREDVESFGLDQQQVLKINGSVDLERFHPTAVQEEIRPQWGVGDQEILVGIVARMQRHRLFDVLLEAVAMLRDNRPSVKLMVLGRGTHMHEVAVEPARRLGLGERVLFPGYRTEDYVDYLGAFDLKVFLVPGSDGTCRAVREAMALGKPIVATRRGMLPELVEDGRTGFLCEETPAGLAQAIARLAADDQLRRRMGRAARAKAVAEFSPAKQAGEVAEFYRKIVARHTELPSQG
jgi:glycosyltransferase involved in cell wall biosynthesis